ncbi:hypothetical protein FACS1894211_10320 [Clostridia bacterium]|nr:hypothetical protein FACS1894211_10320 [Clostridia bacterium]
MTFEIARKGYRPEKVDAYIKQLSLEYENRSAEQRDRIFELKARLQQLEKENAALRGHEAEVSRALMSAVQKSSEMEEMARKKYDLEIQRLKLFHLKWQAYFDEILARYPLNDELQSIADFTEEMRGILGVSNAKKRGAPAKPNVKLTDAEMQHEREKKRLAQKGGPAAPIEAIHKYLDKNARAVKEGRTVPPVPAGTAAALSGDAPPVAAFSLEEALNPKEDLTDILKELGIE